MKKQLIIGLMFAAGLAVTPAIAQENAIAATTELAQDQEKTKLDPRQLPDAVKATIMNDESLQGLNIKEAWQIAEASGETHYKVTFDNAGTDLDKKYKEDGSEIKD